MTFQFEIRLRGKNKCLLESIKVGMVERLAAITFQSYNDGQTG